MANFLADILACAEGDVINYIDFGGAIQRYRFESVTDPRDAGINFSVTYRFEDAKPFLDYEYEDGYGAIDCHDIIAWSDAYVYYIHEYDGSTQVMRLPKRPTKPNLPMTDKSNSPEGG